LAAKKTSRTTTRKVKDKWRSKEWYRVLAPDMFNNTQIAETLSDEREKVVGRVTEVTMQDLTGDFSKMHIKLLFKVDEVNGFDAHTRFIGHTLTSDYIRRLTRRKHSKTDGVFDVLTKDKALVRVKPMAVTEKRIQVSQQQAIRSIMGEVISKEAAKSMHSEFIREMLSGNISKNILKACKPIYPLKRVEIRRSEVRRLPTEKVVEAPSEAEKEEEKPLEKEELVPLKKEEIVEVEEEQIVEGEASQIEEEATEKGEEPKEE
jgi:small subunit ribosomal protein S3Ae